MQPKDWESLYLVALSHGEQLRTRRLTQYWFNKFVESSIGLDGTVSHKTGVTPLFLQLLWQRRDLQQAQQQPTAPVSLGRKEPAARGLSSPIDDAQLGRIGSLEESEDHHSQLSNSCSLPKDVEDNAISVCHDAVEQDENACSFEQFVYMMKQVTVRCYQSARASELLHRFNERVAISSTAVQSMSQKEALHYATRYYFVKAFESAFVSRDSVISLDPERSTLSSIARVVIAHAMARSMDTIVLPLFHRFSKGSGLMQMDQFLSFVGYLFDGLPPPNANYVRAIFCQVNVHNTLSKIAVPEVAGEAPPSSPAPSPREAEIELDEFVDALCLLGVLMFSNEVKHPTLRTVESKLWALLAHVAVLLGVPMCPSPSSDDCVSQLEPRLSLVYPPALPVYAYTGFVVGGICLDVEDTCEPTAKLDAGGRTDDAAFAASSALMASKRYSDEILPPDANGDFLAHSTMLQSRTKQNVVAAQAAKLSSRQFEELLRVPHVLRVPHKPLTARRDWDATAAAANGSTEEQRDRPTSTGNPLECSTSENSRRSPATPGSIPTPQYAATPTTSGVHAAWTNGGGGATTSESTNEDSQSYRSRQPSPASKEIPLSLQPSSTHTQRAAVRKRKLSFFVDGCAVAQHQQVAPSRHKLALPKACLADAGCYTTYCTFRIETSANDEDEEVRSIVSILHRERLVDVTVGEAVEGMSSPNSSSTSMVMYNALPLVLRLKPLERRFKAAVQERLEQLFERHAPTSRMDLQQFTQAVHCMKNMIKTPERTMDAFERFASETNGDVTLSIGKAPSSDATVVRAVFDDGIILVGGPRLSFVAFLHAAAYLYITGAARGDKERSSGTTSKIPNVEGFFELAFEEGSDDAAAGSGDDGGANSSAAPISKQRRASVQHHTRRSMQQLRLAAVEDNVPQSIEAANVWDYRLQAPYDRALHWRELSRSANVALETQWHEQFWQAVEDVPPEPNFTAENPMQTLLSTAIANHHDYDQVLPSMADMGRMSFDARSQSMQLEYFTSAMVRTLSNR